MPATAVGWLRGAGITIEARTIFEIIAEVKDDRRVVLTLPPEVPTGQAKLLVSVYPSQADKKRPRTSLADWTEANAENWGDRLSSEEVDGFTGRRF